MDLFVGKMGKSVCFTLALLIFIKGSHSQLNVCGQAPLNKIVGGVNAPQGAWPWQVSLQSYVYGGHFCGGSLINDQWILTAAHCLSSVSVSDLVVYLGMSTQQGVNINEVNKTVSKIIVHPSYNSQTNDNDIGLLQLSSPVVFNDYIRPVCLAAQNSSFPSGTNSWITGWGDIASGVGLPAPGTLQETMIPVVDNVQCNNLLGAGIVTNNMMCAGLLQGGKDTCQGDSGGPMVSENCSVWVQSGITSFGFGCADPNAPGVYTRVSQYQNWITTTISQNIPGFIIFNPESTCSSMSSTTAPTSTRSSASTAPRSSASSASAASILSTASLSTVSRPSTSPSPSTLPRPSTASTVTSPSTPPSPSTLPRPSTASTVSRPLTPPSSSTLPRPSTASIVLRPSTPTSLSTLPRPSTASTVSRPSTPPSPSTLPRPSSASTVSRPSTPPSPSTLPRPSTASTVSRPSTPPSPTLPRPSTASTVSRPSTPTSPSTLPRPSTASTVSRPSTPPSPILSRPSTPPSPSTLPRPSTTPRPSTASTASKPPASPSALRSFTASSAPNQPSSTPRLSTASRSSATLKTSTPFAAPQFSQSCYGRCDERFDFRNRCNCNDHCLFNCCKDYAKQCRE